MPKKWKPTSNRDLFIGILALSLFVVFSSFQKASNKHESSKMRSISMVKQTIAPEFSTFEPPKKGVMITHDFKKIVRIPSRGLYKDRSLLRRYASQTVGLIAQASDKNFYYANGFFQDFIPFKVNNVYNAMNFIAQRLRYEYDEKLFNGSKELWQTSKEAYVRMRGDCEDHAILLADWLESLGYDARVAVGTHKGGGHAWVVWFDKGEAYIIEATNKRQRRFYPLAKSMYDYQAYYMFNKKSFWERSRQILSNDYKTGWNKRAYFKALPTKL